MGEARLRLDRSAWDLVEHRDGAEARAVDTMEYICGGAIAAALLQANTRPRVRPTTRIIRAFISTRRPGGELGTIQLSFDALASRMVREPDRTAQRLIEAMEYFAGPANQVIHTYEPPPPTPANN